MGEEHDHGLRGAAQTVLGPVDGRELGVTLPHEHLLSDARFYFQEPASPKERELARQPVSLQNLNWCVHHPYNNLDAYLWDDEELTIQELMLFKEGGGTTVVDATPQGLGRDPLALVRIARGTGINVVMTAGYYVAGSHPEDVGRKTESELADELVRDITVGVDDSGVRAGFLKAACGNPSRIEDNERKVMRACALAQRRTGAPMGVHNTTMALCEDIIEVLRDAGADLSRTILIHSGYFAPIDHMAAKIMEADCYISFDRLGSEQGFVPDEGDPYPQNDCGASETIRRLIDEGYLERILLSQDVFMKQDHISFGGKGYAHIVNYTVDMMRSMGITDDHIHTMMIGNPQRLFSFV